MTASSVKSNEGMRTMAAAIAAIFSVVTLAQTGTAPSPSSPLSPLSPPSPDPITIERPNSTPQKYPLPDIDPKQVSPPTAFDERSSLPVPDRWRIMESLRPNTPWFDPYNQNVLKGDKPFEPFAKWGHDWFLNVGAVSDSLMELRRLPTPVGAQSSLDANSNDTFGRAQQSVYAQTFLFSLAAIKGDTTFRPPDYEFRFSPAININYAKLKEIRGVRADPRAGTTRKDNHVAIQELFADVHWRNVSPRFDFDSVRIGIQPFISDFRGFIFNDVPFGVRVFGNRDNNQWQYNLGAFRRIEKDTNSGLNDLRQPLRRDDVLVANLYRQDFLVPGFTAQATIIHNINRERGADYYNNNGGLERPAVIGDVRPHQYRVTYLGLNGDGHIGRWNLTASAYAALGKDTRSPLSQTPQKIRAGFAALELSRDLDWVRVRGNALIASGDKNPFDNISTGFDAILENPQFAGADTSFFIRQAVPLIGGGGVSLSGRNGILPSLRSSKDQGQSNFVNPGLTLIGVGADADITPHLRLTSNLSSLRFVNTASLSVLRNQGAINKALGTDVSVGMQYRPLATQNIILNISAAALLPGKGLKQLYDENKRGARYSVLANLVVTF